MNIFLDGALKKGMKVKGNHFKQFLVIFQAVLITIIMTACSSRFADLPYPTNENTEYANLSTQPTEGKGELVGALSLDYSNVTTGAEQLTQYPLIYEDDSAIITIIKEWY